MAIGSPVMSLCAVIGIRVDDAENVQFVAVFVHDAEQRVIGASEHVLTLLILAGHMDDCLLDFCNALFQKSNASLRILVSFAEQPLLLFRWVETFKRQWDGVFVNHS